MHTAPEIIERATPFINAVIAELPSKIFFDIDKTKHIVTATGEHKQGNFLIARIKYRRTAKRSGTLINILMHEYALEELLPDERTLKEVEAALVGTPIPDLPQPSITPIEETPPPTETAPPPTTEPTPTPPTTAPETIEDIRSRFPSFGDF